MRNQQPGTKNGMLMRATVTYVVDEPMHDVLNKRSIKTLLGKIHREREGGGRRERA